MCSKLVVLVCLLLYGSAFAGTLGTETIPQLDDENYVAQANTSAEEGPPDSHEAMNDRNHGNPREKRSYEFLIGLVHNNSKYEVTRVDPRSTTETPTMVQGTNGTAGDALLQLMVKIASYPEQWDKVHKLLQTINDDLSTTKKIVDDIEHKREEGSDLTSQLEPKEASYKEDKRQDFSDYQQDTLVGHKMRYPTNHADRSIQAIPNTTHANDRTNSWPEFHHQKYGTVKSSYLDVKDPDTVIHARPNPAYTGSFRNFAYRVVTDRPLIHSKSPKAYIAVSLIAPKPIEPQEEDILLESELRELKPWPYRQDIQNAEFQPQYIKKADNGD